MDQQLPVESDTEESYDLSENTLLTAAVIVLCVVVVMAALHLCARCRVILCRRRRRRRTIVFYTANSRLHPAVDLGLDPSVLNSLPVFLYSSDAAEELPSLDCAVCLSEFEENEAVRLLPKCRHAFHVDCIGMWLHSHSTCPLCRSVIEPVVNRTGPDGESASDAAGSSSETRMGANSRNDGNTDTASFWGRRKLLGLRIEGRAESDSELTQSSSLLSLKRLLSVSGKPPGGGGGGGGGGRQNPAAGTSRGAAELDLECGLTGPVRAT